MSSYFSCPRTHFLFPYHCHCLLNFVLTCARLLTSQCTMTASHLSCSVTPFPPYHCNYIVYSSYIQLQCSLLSLIIQSCLYTFFCFLGIFLKQTQHGVLCPPFLLLILGGVGYDCHTSSTPFSYSLSLSSSYPHVYHFLLPILNSCSSVSHSCIKNDVVIKTTCTLSINAQHIPTVVHIPYRTFCCRDAHLQLTLYCLITLHGNNNQLTAIFHKLLRCLFFLLGFMLLVVLIRNERKEKDLHPA